MPRIPCKCPFSRGSEIPRAWHFGSQAPNASTYTDTVKVARSMHTDTDIRAFFGVSALWTRVPVTVPASSVLWSSLLAITNRQLCHDGCSPLDFLLVLAVLSLPMSYSCSGTRQFSSVLGVAARDTL